MIFPDPTSPVEFRFSGKGKRKRKRKKKRKKIGRASCRERVY
jgi:hypothetical protein